MESITIGKIWLFVLLAGLSSESAFAQSWSQTCRATEVCNTHGGVRYCRKEQHCWWQDSGISTMGIYLKPEGASGPGTFAQGQPFDRQNDGQMDCWKSVTNGASESSGFPLRNNGVDTHNGIDVTSSQGRGAPIRNMGIGVVSDIGYDKDSRNGIFVRVTQGNGVEMTYIHMLDVAPGLVEGSSVQVGASLGRMNCTGYCGGPPTSPSHQQPSSTHVHIQAKRISDGALLDPRALHGGPTCNTPSESDGSTGGSGPGGRTGTCNGTTCTDEP